MEPMVSNVSTHPSLCPVPVGEKVKDPEDDAPTKTEINIVTSDFSRGSAQAVTSLSVNHSLGDFILEQYATSIDPSQTQTDTILGHDHDSFKRDLSTAPNPRTARRLRTLTVDRDEDKNNIHNDELRHSDVTAKSTIDEPVSSSLLRKVPNLSSINFLPESQSHLARRRQARVQEVPRQTILKAMASRSLINGPLSAPISRNGFSSPTFPQQQQQQKQPPQREKETEANAQCVTTALTNTQNPASASLSSTLLRSPCFFHQRFEGLVDIQKVLDEISEEEYSHSRLMQTATGVREVSKQLQRRPLKRAVRTVMIVTRARDNSLVYKTRELAEWLVSTPRYGGELGVNVYVDAKLRHSRRFDADGLVAKEPRFKDMLKYWTPDLCWSSPEKFDLVLTLGGDGTVLFTSWLFQRVVPPILSFALGSLGFLTNFEFNRYKDHLNNVMGDAGMRVNLRMRFTCTVWRQDRSPGAEKGAVEEGEQFEVLNELVIDRGPSSYVSNLELYGDGELLTVVQADGCIFSTPTGSTAYSLSAGGSLIHPIIPAILLTPICPHSLSFRPMVLSDALSLRIAVPHRSRSSAHCSFDGKGRIELRQGDYVTLEASQYPFPTVMTGTNEWVESVQRALRWNVRGAEQKGWDANADEDGTVEEWDIDIEPIQYNTSNGTDSGIGPSEGSDAGGGAGTSSPMRRQMSLLNI